MKPLLTLLCAASIAFTHSAALSSPVSYPDKPIRFLVPYTPGGNADLLARTIGHRLSTAWNTPVVVENRPGASGTIAVDMAAKSKPDGYTMVLAVFGNILVAKELYSKLPYDPVQDLAPVILIATPPTALVASADFAPNNVKELIAYGKENPGKLYYGSSGNGTSNHLFGELFASMAKVQMTHIPYKGMGPAINDLIGGRVQLAFAPFPLVLPQIKAGKLKALAVSGKTRSPAMPHVPTIAESGLPGYEGSGWFAVMVPKATPKAIVAKLNTEIDQLLKQEEVRASLAAEGAVPVGGSVEDAARSISEGTEKWGGLIHKLGLKAE